MHSELAPTNVFLPRHLGPSAADRTAMLTLLGVASLDELTAQTVPAGILRKQPLDLGPSVGESELLAGLKVLAAENQIFRSYIGQGYYDCLTPSVIQRGILENPGWYTQYTPYQAEISQGRLEALVNFQTMVSDLTGLPLTNASLLDEATAAAEALAMCVAADGQRKHVFVDAAAHPQVIAVVQTRMEPLAVTVTVGSRGQLKEQGAGAFAAALLASPTTDGVWHDDRTLIKTVRAAGCKVVVACDLLALTLGTSPGEMGADVAVGSTQRFGVPMGFGGPHAAFFATTDEFKRLLPGRIIGVSKDARGNVAYRLALQTREQHIRREKATSNICTSQVLLAVMASMYAVYHGPDGLRAIATRVRRVTGLLAAGLATLGMPRRPGQFFDTIRCDLSEAKAQAAVETLSEAGINIRRYADGIGFSCDETTTVDDVRDVLTVLRGGETPFSMDSLVSEAPPLGELARTSPYLTHPVFHRYHSEHEMLRYMRRLESKDLSLTTSMIPLGSCTMKLNATTEMIPVTWPEFGKLHPFAPSSQTAGYQTMLDQLSAWLAEITGFAAVSLQPNSGAQGEYAGLLAIRAYHKARGEAGRNVCLIPTSAHGTNPASAALAGFRVVAVAAMADGTIDHADLTAKLREHGPQVGALMVTYPSTHGVFEEGIVEICAAVHAAGGQVYMDGANMNAQVGLTRPGDIGADVCHLNLHKTFCIPHGGGGPGMGPIGVAKHLAPFLPGHPLESGAAAGAVSAAPWGSASILPISFAYIAMMGAEGLKMATQVAILNANYIAARLGGDYPVLYTGKHGRVAHELILDCRPFKKSAGVEAEDIAKRLMDFGFHAPTMSFPVVGTLMIEPTESESKAELDRFCDAMLAIRAEIRAIETGSLDKLNNPLKNAPHTARMCSGSEWPHPYTREQAAYPLPYLREHKFWPSVARVDNAYGDRNLVCSCPPMSDYT